MAMDASWDNSGLPPQKKGMATWVKVLAGCGIVMVLLIGSCVGLGVWGFQKGKTFIQEQGSTAWNQLATYERQMETDEGAQALYQANPGLASTYPTETEFLKAVQEWRPKLAPLPAQMPDLLRAMREQSFELNVKKNNGHSNRSAGVRMNAGGFLLATWVDDKLTDVEVTNAPVLTR